MWQEIAIIIIGLIVLLYIGRKIYKLLAHPPKAGDPCCGCTGCNLKDVKKSRIKEHVKNTIRARFIE